jgi:hypothetical protein
MKMLIALMVAVASLNMVHASESESSAAVVIQPPTNEAITVTPADDALRPASECKAVCTFVCPPPAENTGETVTAANILDGKTFVTLEDEPDELIFEHGTFFSATCAQWGFEASPITADVDGSVIQFQTESISPKHGKMSWQGTITGDTLEGSYEWTKKRWYWKDAHKVKQFTAMLKQP